MIAKNTMVYIYINTSINKDIYIYKWILILNGAGICQQKAPYFYEIVYVLTYFDFFQTITALFSNRHCNLSKGRHKVRPRFLEGISRSLKNTTWDHRHWRIVCKKMPNLCPKCTLSALFRSSFIGIFFEKCQILQKTR